MSAEVRVGYGRNLEHYRTKSIKSQNLDIEVILENGDTIQVNTRERGFAIKFKPKNKDTETLKDVDY